MSHLLTRLPLRFLGILFIFTMSFLLPTHASAFQVGDSGEDGTHGEAGDPGTHGTDGTDGGDVSVTELPANQFFSLRIWRIRRRWWRRWCRHRW